ncbi:MAG: purine-binding chemotaxis protein CheW [Methanomicrobiales archaeon]|mgnify:FL=1|nr:purine-binding chemotaxis protein CheW [Methanomicrobiales archaeon]
MKSDIITSADNTMQPEYSSSERREKAVEGMQFVEFMLGHECYAINLFHTREVITPNEITPLPGASPYVKGMMDLRGSITTIIDLKKMMNITSESGLKHRSRIIILDQEFMEKPLGILVDDVSSVSTYRLSDIDKETKNDSNNVRYISGVIKKTVPDEKKENHNFILWLNIFHMMDSIKQDF